MKNKVVAASHSWSCTQFSVFKYFAVDPQVSALLLVPESIYSGYVSKMKVIGNYAYIGTETILYRIPYCKLFLVSIILFTKTGEPLVKKLQSYYAET